MKKLTLVLVALLLALTCVFVACGKKNETPADTDPKPTDNPPAPVETPTVEDMTPVAEQFKKDLAANYVDLYSKEVETAIESEKAAALLKIMGASTKAEAQKIADEFITFLKAQKTSYDVLKDLVAQIGDVALADEDLIKEANAYNAALDAEFAGTNAAKKAVLDAYKADEATQKAVTDAFARLKVLQAVKTTADTKDTGLNAKIAALNKAFTDEDKKGFNLDDVNEYAKLLAAINKLASDNEIEVDSDAYNEIFDVTTLAGAKAILDAAIEADPVLSLMKGVVEADAALRAAAEDARYKVYEWIYDDSTIAVAAKATKEEEIEAAKAAAKAAGVDFDEKKVVEVETTASAATKNYSKSAVNTAKFKLALQADVKAAVAVKDNFLKRTNATQREDKGYATDGSDIVGNAVESILAIEKAYKDSLANAKSTFAAVFEDAYYVDTKLEKEKSTAVYANFTSNKAKSTYKTDLAAELDALKASLKTVDADGNKLSYVDGIDLTVGTYEVDSTHYVDLMGGIPAVTYTTWTYSFKLGNTALNTSNTTVFNVLNYIDKASKAAKAQEALDWLTIYIGEGDYADKYELKKDYGFTTDLIMVDQDVEEVATARVVEIKGTAVDAAKSTTLAAKLLSPYTIAKAVVAENAKIKAAKDDALAELKAATLALREVGDANAIKAARKLYNDMASGKYLNDKLYEGKVTVATEINLLKVDGLSTAEVVVREADDTVKPAVTELSKKINAIITDAEAILDKADDLAVAKAAAALKGYYDAIATAQAAVDANSETIALYDLVLAKAKALLDAAEAGNAAKLVSDEDLKIAKAEYEKVDVLKNLLLNKTVFADLNGGTINGDDTLAVAPATTVTGKYIDIDNAAKDSANDIILSKFTPDGVSGSEIVQLCADLDAIITVNDKDRKELIADVTAAEVAYAEKLEEFEGFDALKASDANKTDEKNTLKNATTGLTKLVADFAKNYVADYINLKVTVDLGDDTLTFDYLTEAYRELEMIKTYGVVADVVALDSTGLTAGTPSWETVAQTSLDDEDFAVDTVTSLKAADEALKAFKLDDDVYNLVEALRIIVKTDDTVTYDQVKALNK